MKNPDENHVIREVKCDCGYAVRGSRMLAHGPGCSLVAATRAACTVDSQGRVSGPVLLDPDHDEKTEPGIDWPE